MIILRALFRAVVVALAIWAGQSVIGPTNHSGIWAMVTLGIAAATLGVLLSQYVVWVPGRWQQAGIAFFGTGVVLSVYYLLLPKSAVMAAPDFILALTVAAISGMSEWFVPDVMVDRKMATKRRT